MSSSALKRARAAGRSLGDAFKAVCFLSMFPHAPMPSRSRFRIRCINRTGRRAVHQKIRFIGGLNADGSAWKLSQEMAVESIENGKCQLYLLVDRQPVPVIVAVSHHGHKYLKAQIDPGEPSSLLNLPECPFLTQ